MVWISHMETKYSWLHERAKLLEEKKKIDSKSVLYILDKLVFDILYVFWIVL